MLSACTDVRLERYAGMSLRTRVTLWIDWPESDFEGNVSARKSCFRHALTYALSVMQEWAGDTRSVSFEMQVQLSFNQGSVRKLEIVASLTFI